jgi:uncharacterized membrane protein YwaF
MSNKTDSTPLDKGVFGALNAGLVGFIFSIHFFNKKFEIPRTNRFSFVGRNMLLFSTIYGLNQYIMDFIPKAGITRNKYIIDLCSTVIPISLGYFVYSYRNKFIFFTKEYFIGLGVIFMLVELLDVNVNKNNL